MKNKSRLLTISLISTALMWLIVGNIYTQQQKRTIDQYWGMFFAEKIKIVKKNQSASNLENLLASLHNTLSNDKPLSLSHNLQELNQYFDNQFKNNNFNINKDTQDFNQILVNSSPHLKAASRLLLTSELPKWDTEIYLDMNFSTRSSSYISFAVFQKILALDSLHKIISGQQEQSVLENLEVGWRGKEAVRQHPTLISQLVSLIMDYYLIGILRQLDDVPSEWQSRINQLLYQDYYNSFLIGLELEIFSYYNSLSSLSNFNQNTYLKDDINILKKYQIANNLSDKLIDFFSRPYLNYSAIDFYEKRHSFLKSMPSKNFCNIDIEAYEKQHLEPLASWNPMENNQNQLSIGVWLKLFRRLIDWELTLKILQVKELAIKQGKWPEQVPGIESSICEDRQWIYQVSPDGKTMSIFYSQPPSWWQRQETGTLNYPFTYSSQKIPQPRP